MVAKKAGIIRDVFGELGETVKQTASQAAQVPGDVAKGVLGQPAKKDQAPIADNDTDEKAIGVKSDTLALDPKQAQQQAILAQKKAQDKKWSEQKYKQIQDKLRKVQIERQRQREQGLDVYVTAKPGEAETLEEKQEQVKKQRKLAEEQKKKEKKLPASVRAGMGTAERVKPVSG